MLKIAALLCLFVTLAGAEDRWVNTQAPASARYELLVVYVPNTTFRLDKYTGQVAHLVGKNPEDYHWEPMQVVDPPAVGNSPRYQLSFLNNSIFLLDLETGRTWQVTPPYVRDGNRWIPVPDNSGVR